MYKIQPTIRIKKIVIKNLKNVKNGEILCECGRKFVEAGTEPDIVGLYGQNGSGKSSVIIALAILQNIILGNPVNDFLELINVESDFAFLDFTFDYQYEDGRKREIEYSFKICKKNVISPFVPVETIKRVNPMGFSSIAAVLGVMATTYSVINSSGGNNKPGNSKGCVIDECIQVSGDFDEKYLKRQIILDTSINESGVHFGPISKRKYFVNESNKYDLMGNYIASEREGTSFIFQERTIEEFLKVKSEFTDVLIELKNYCSKQLFVVTSTNYDAVRSSGYLCFYSQRTSLTEVNVNKKSKNNNSKETHSLISPIIFPLNSHTEILKDEFPEIKKEIDNVSLVLSNLVPGNEIFLKQTQESININGEEIVFAEIMSKKNGSEMPLRYESDGLLKLIGILNCLIMAYNRKSVTVAIDEIDSGVFEYLLGEILQVFEEGGRGQLFFSSHNLRPLEVLSKKYLYFTTTDENNRYIHMKNIGKTNNLRNVYFREILGLEGDSDVKLYSGTQRNKIALAFRKACDYE